MVFIIIGLVLGVGVLVSINHTNLFGVSCYHFGAFTPATFCLKSGVYFGALGIAAALVILGLALLIRKNSASTGA